jgi:glycerol-3-phosphate dehydrogenase subunit C
VQNIGKKTEEMLKMIPGTSVQTTSAAPAMPAPSASRRAPPAGHEDRQAVFKAMAAHKDGGAPDVPDISSDCPLGGHHIAQGF